MENLLQQCGWLSVRQLVRYHRLVLVYQVKENGRPAYFKEHFSTTFPYRTRLASGRGIRRGDHPHHQVTQSSFVKSSAVYWNLLPVSIRNSQTQSQFKNRLKNWIKMNVPIYYSYQSTLYLYLLLPHPGLWVASVGTKVLLYLYLQKAIKSI